MRLAQAFRITSAAAALAAVAVYAAPSTVEGGGLAARGVFNIDFSTVFKSLWKSLVSDAGYSNSDYCAANGNSITSSYCSNLLSKLTVTKASIKSRLTSNGVASTAAGVYAAKFMYSMLYGSDKTLALSYYNSADKSTAKWEFCFNAAATVKSDFSISGCNRAASNNKTLYLEVADVIDIAGNTTLDGYPKLFPQIFNDANCFDVFYTCCRSANSLCAVTNKTTVYDVYSNIASLDIPASVSSAIANTANARRSEVGEVHDLTARDISITLSGKYIKYGVAAYNLYKDIKDIFDSLDSSWDKIYKFYVRLVGYTSNGVSKFKSALNKVATTATTIYNGIPGFITATKKLFTALSMADDAIVSQIQSMNAMMSGEYADKQLVAQACDSVILKTMSIMGVSSPCTQSVIYAVNSVSSAYWVSTGYVDQIYSSVSSAQCSSYLSMCCAMKASCGSSW